MLLRLTLVERALHRLRLLPVPVMDAFASVLFGRALAIGVRKGIFEAVAKQPRALNEIAGETGLSEQGVELLVKAFVIAGYVKATGDRFVASADARKWLVKSSPSYIGNLINYFETLYTRWNTLEGTLERGTPQKSYFELFDEKDWEIYVHGMQDLARMLTKEVMTKIQLESNATRLLDIGGSHGLYSIECCRRYPSLQATVLDFDGALRHTGPLLWAERMEERVRLHAGDFTKMELPSPQDCILMFNIIHGFSEDDNRTLVARAINALKPGGKLYILDQMKETPGRSGLAQFIPLMIGLNLLNEIGGNTYTFEQVKTWCAGAKSVKRLRLRLPGVTLVEALKN
jgi:SAM-dependent methyltransferase